MNAPAPLPQDPRYAERIRVCGYAAFSLVYAEDGRHVATMQQTLMMLAGTADAAQ